MYETIKALLVVSISANLWNGMKAYSNESKLELVDIRSSRSFEKTCLSGDYPCYQIEDYKDLIELSKRFYLYALDSEDRVYPDVRQGIMLGHTYSHKHGWVNALHGGSNAFLNSLSQINGHGSNYEWCLLFLIVPTEPTFKAKLQLERCDKKHWYAISMVRLTRTKIEKEVEAIVSNFETLKTGMGASVMISH